MLIELQDNQDEKAQEFTKYYESLNANKKKIEKLIDFYYNTLINKIKNDEKFKGVNAKDLEEIVIQSARLTEQNNDA